MKNIYKKNKLVWSWVLFLALASCETIETDLTDDPSGVGTDNASIEFVFNKTQLDLASFFQGTQFDVSQAMRMELMDGSPLYGFHYSPTTFDSEWTTAYAGFLRDAQLVKELAANIDGGEVNGNYYLAAVQIMEAYVITTLADIFGDIPYSEALQGGENFNPSRDAAEDIYAAAFSLLNNSISLIEAGNSVNLGNDFYYNKDMNKWIRLANSLKLKLAIQSRLHNTDAASIANGVINSGNYITQANESFVFNYSNYFDAGNDSRHPLFQSQYVGGAGIYMAKPYIEIMVGDPRYNYYFYHQSGEIYAREHGDNGPPVATDYPKLTVHGLYPVGGKYNDGTTGSTNPNMGAAGNGAGIIFTNAFTQFVIAEAQLMLNNNMGAARIALENGVRSSISYVMNFRPNAIPPEADVPSQADIDAYVSSVLSEYDAASGNEAKLDVVLREYYKALWGNGIEAYNNYRRTGYPSGLPASMGQSGTFAHTMYYPSVHVTNNSNAPQRADLSEKVWWAEGTTFNLDF